jgi:hypothetical protein
MDKLRKIKFKDITDTTLENIYLIVLGAIYVWMAELMSQIHINWIGIGILIFFFLLLLWRIDRIERTKRKQEKADMKQAIKDALREDREEQRKDKINNDGNW